MWSCSRFLSTKHSLLGDEQQQQHSLKNWSGNIQFTPLHIYQPTTLKQLQTHISDAVQSGHSITPVGSIHSFSSCTSTHEVMIDMTAFNKFISIDKAQNLVTAEAGIKLDTLYSHMIHHGVAFGTLP